VYLQHKYLLVHLSCHSIIKTKQGPFNRANLASLGGESRRVPEETWWPKSNTLSKVLQQRGLEVD